MPDSMLLAKTAPQQSASPYGLDAEQGTGLAGLLSNDASPSAPNQSQTPPQARTKATVFMLASGLQYEAPLAALGEANQFSVAYFSTAESFFDVVDSSSAGCLIADLCAKCLVTGACAGCMIPDIGASAFQAQLKYRNIVLPVIFLTNRPALRDVVSVMKQGAMDVLENPFSFKQLSGVVLESIEHDAKYRSQIQKAAKTQKRLAELTERERVVAEQLILGKTNREIAEFAGVGLRTIQFRRSSLMKKLGVSSRGALIESLVPLTSE